MTFAALIALLTLGMPKEELLSARPEIIRKTSTGVVVPIARPTVVLREELPPSHAPYRFAEYHVKDGKLAGMSFMGYQKPEDIRGARIEAISVAKSIWGPSYGVELSRDLMSAYGASPVLVWLKDGVFARLRVPPDPVPGKPTMGNITLTIGMEADRVRDSSVIVLPGAARAKLLEECGVTDAAPSDLTIDQLAAAPETAELGGRTLRLDAYLRRQEHGPDRRLTARFSVKAVDRGALPPGLAIERAWARRGNDLWTVAELAPAPGETAELAVKAAGGPLWPGDKASVYVKVSVPGGASTLLRARVNVVNVLD